MEKVYAGLRLTHIVLGFFCVAAFWMQVFAKKGGAVHVRTGTIYVFSLTVVLITAAVASGFILVDPSLKAPGAPPDVALRLRIGQLNLLWATAITGASCWQGVRALRFKRGGRKRLDPHGLLAWAHRFCIVSVVPLSAANLLFDKFIQAGIAIVMLPAAVWNLRALTRFGSEKRDWYYEHLRGMLLSGVVVQAIFVMVALTRYIFPFGFIAVATVWVLPFVIGLLAIRLALRYFRRKLGDAAVAQKAA